MATNLGRSEVITCPEIQDRPDDEIRENLTRWVPQFAKGTDRNAGDLIGSLESVIEHELWRKVGAESMEEYAREYLRHSEVWCHEVVRIFNFDWDPKQRRDGTVGDLSAKQQELATRKAESERLVLDEGKTQQEAAEVLGVSQKTVHNDLVRNLDRAEKVTNPRSRARIELNAGTAPTTAAQRIREKFGDEYAAALREALN